VNRNLDIQRLRTFVTVVDTGSMTRAAAVLHQTQGAVSQQIRKLESELGEPLLVRSRQGLSVTEPGERLCVKARRLLALNDTIWCEMTTPRCVGRVTFGIPMDLAGERRIASALRSFASNYPDVEVNLHCASSQQLKRAVKERKLDVAILEEFSRDQLGEKLVTDRLSWIGAPGGNAIERDPLPLSLGGDACIFRPRVLEALEVAGRRWKSVYESGYLEASLAVIRTDLAVGAVLSSRRPDDVACLGESLPTLPEIAITLYASGNGAEPAAALTDHLRDSLQAGWKT